MRKLNIYRSDWRRLLTVNARRSAEGPLPGRWKADHFRAAARYIPRDEWALRGEETAGEGVETWKRLLLRTKGFWSTK